MYIRSHGHNATCTVQADQDSVDWLSKTGYDLLKLKEKEKFSIWGPGTGEKVAFRTLPALRTQLGSENV